MDAILLQQIDAAYSFARWTAGDRLRAETALEEVMTTVLPSRNRLRGAGGRAWILGIARSVTLSRMHSPNPSEAHRGPQTFSDLALPGQPGSPVDRRAAGKELQSSDIETLRRAVAALAFREREVLLLRDTHALSYREIIKILHVPVETMMSRLRAARDALESCAQGTPTLRVNHEQSLVLMDAYIDAETDIDAAAAFVGHIAQCRSCTSWLLNRSRIVQSIRAVTACRTPQELRSRVQKQLATDPQQTSQRQSTSRC